ncbi:MAG TPA: ribonucleoside-diphosphate reductase, adenosylcobalamin-dependent, partial [Anaerolineales bacterium]|nr:ribonucleoside-diphosphate reductase, adenosylcobalamin-dependent [Anaerolineales bacterium]
PCGEQWLGPYENCCLGSVNLAQHFGPNNNVDWEGLQKSVELATRFLEDVVQANSYVPAVPQLQQAAYRARRIGLGLMGLADLMYHVGVRYGSEVGQEFSAQVMEFIRFHSMLTSIELAKDRGPFEAIEGSIYDPKDLTWQPPQPLFEYQNNWDRPKVNWSTVIDGIGEHGIRNAAQTTIAPTGTIATVAGCEGYGCEPVFALAYIRHVNDNGKDLKLKYTSPLFNQALEDAGLDEVTRATIFDQVLESGTCQGISALPDHIRQTFVVSQDIIAEDHVRMQAALQAFVDNSLSKTINFPEITSVGDIANTYKLAWELGCKGITVYVTGSRQKVVLETHSVAKEKDSLQAASATDVSELRSDWQEAKKPRPRRLPGNTIFVETPLGKTFVTVNENGGQQPFEVFVNTAKAGSETAAVSEAIGRLISYILRMVSPVSPRERLKEVWRQLSGIGGGRPLGFGPNRVRSLPDGVAQAIEEYLKNSEQSDLIYVGDGNGHYPTSDLETEQINSQIGDLCPDCGQAAVVYEEGCRKCYACAYSEC